MQPFIGRGTIGEVTGISYPVRGGVQEPTVHVVFKNGHEIKKPLTSNVCGIPVTFDDWFKRLPTSS